MGKKNKKKKSLDVGSYGAPVSPSMEMMGKYHKHEIASAANTLMDAHEIMMDPEKMKHVDKHLKMKKDAIESTADLRAHAQKKYGGT